MANMLLDNGLSLLNFARQATLAFLGDIPEDRLCYRPIPEGNHAVWLIGHIALTDDSVRNKLGGGAAKCPQEWSKLFGQGSKPLPDPSDYPSSAEMKAHLSGTREDLIGWFKSMSEAKLTEHLPGDDLRAPNYAALMAFLAYHEGLHAGQLRVIGQALGKPPKFG